MTFSARQAQSVTLIRKSTRGFTLLEVTIALAILVLSLTILVENQGLAALMSREADRIRTATMLAEEKMIEAQLQLEVEGWTSSDIEEDGDFEDLGSEEFRGDGLRLELDDRLEDFKWAYTVRKIELNFPTDLGGLTEDLSGSGYFGDQNSEAVQDNTMDLGDIGVSPDMISDYLSDYIREVRVRVWWGENEDEDDQVELLTHIVNPTGVVSNPEDEQADE